MTLKTMHNHARENFVSDIAMPFLGAGRDKLDFYNVVLPMIKTVFGDSPINVHIYYPKSRDLHLKRLVIYNFGCLHNITWNFILYFGCSHGDKNLSI